MKPKRSEFLGAQSLTFTPIDEGESLLVHTHTKVLRREGNNTHTPKTSRRPLNLIRFKHSSSCNPTV